MDHFLEGKTTEKNIHIKRYGYLLSAIFLILSNVSYVAGWVATPWLFLITIYLLTGSLWIPALLRPIYRLGGKHIISPTIEKREKQDQSFFSKN